MFLTRFMVIEVEIKAFFNKNQKKTKFLLQHLIKTIDEALIIVGNVEIHEIEGCL